MHTLPNLGPLLQPFDEVLNHYFIPAITESHHCSRDERKLLSLPARLGGLAIPIFSKIAKKEYEYSKKASQQLTENIKFKSQTAEHSFDNPAHHSTKNDIKRTRNLEHEQTLAGLQERMNGDQKRVNEIAQMKGASNWFTSLQIREENYVLNKREFYDAIRMRYRWPLMFIPTTCACGKRLS